MKLLKTVALLVFFFEACCEAQEQKSSSPELSRIAFGSCNHQDRPQPLWEVIVKNNPQLWIWTGDSIYADTEDMSLMKKMYAKQKQNSEYQKLLKTCPVIGCWDDHDYGKNNAGKEYPKKAESQALMLEFLDEPKESPRYQQEGAYASYSYGPEGKQIKVILLDVRYHRDPPGLEADTLGDAQWEWLEEELQNSKAQIHLIISGVEVIVEEHPYEKWANFPKARQRLFDLIGKTKTKGVIFISGDRHIAEISKIEGTSAGYPLYDITASGMTHSWSDFKEEKNRYRVGEVYPDLHFGWIEIQWTSTPPVIELQIRNRGNKVPLSTTLKLSDLAPAE
ncbi:MAG: alkaline phosphatase D family protein [Planctomycetota bacterium]